MAKIGSIRVVHCHLPERDRRLAEEEVDSWEDGLEAYEDLLDLVCEDLLAEDDPSSAGELSADEAR